MLRPLFRRLPEPLQHALRRLRARMTSRAIELGAAAPAAVSALPADAAPAPAARPADAYATSVREETGRFAQIENVNDLPPIYIYWGDRWLAPMLAELGFTSLDDFYVHYLIEAARRCGSDEPRFLSVGSGNCDTEVSLARQLRARGLDRFTITCLDLTPEMLARGRELAAQAALAEHIVTVAGDFNEPLPRGPFDAVIANQSLHHVVKLEHLFDQVLEVMHDRGLFLSSDVIGRNGHLRWPEALAIVHEFWPELPESYRWNVQLRRQEPIFDDWDCSAHGFEGVRAQDVLPCLVERFGFEFFLAFGNAVDPFIDRSFGPHFDPSKEWDRTFIDRVHARDDAEILAGRLSPAHMFAAMTKDRTAVPRVRGPLTPEFCIRRDPAERAAAARRAKVRIRRRASHPDGHFYSPVVDTKDVAARAAEIWPERPLVLGIDFNADYHRRVLAEWFPRFMPAFDYPEELPESAELTQFYVRNSQFSWLDCRALFVLLQAWRPRRMIEVGSGFSTLLAADVNRRFLDGTLQITCIEPYPREFLKRGIPGVAQLIEQRVERVDLAVFEALEPGDLLFIDSSHVAKTGSDVNHLVFEVLPRLKPGVRIHIHDIFLPHEYLREWVLTENRSWNEQYLVRALLMYSNAFRVLFGCSFAFHEMPELVREALAHAKGHAYAGGSLYLERM